MLLNGVRGELAEWLRSGLQIRLHRFDSGTRLHPSPIVVYLIIRYRWSGYFSDNNGQASKVANTKSQNSLSFKKEPLSASTALTFRYFLSEKKFLDFACGRFGNCLKNEFPGHFVAGHPIFAPRR